MAVDVELDRGGIRQLLKSAELAREVNALAERIAANVRSHGQLVANDEPMPVEVTSYTTDRSAAAVTITHAAGLAVQAKHGLLTRAAAAEGLEVREKR